MSAAKGKKGYTDRELVALLKRRIDNADGDELMAIADFILDCDVEEADDDSNVGYYVTPREDE